MKREEILLTQNEFVGQMSALLAFPVAGFVFFICFKIYGFEFFMNNDNAATVIALVASLLTLMPHELMHFMGWKIATKRGHGWFHY